MTQSSGQCSGMVCALSLGSRSDFNSTVTVSSCPEGLRTSDHLFTSGEAEFA